MNQWLPALVFVPILGALVAVVAPRSAAYVVGLCSAAVLALTVTLTVRILRGEILTAELAGWAEPVGIGLHVDGFSAAMLLLTAVVGSAVAVYASGSEKVRGNRFFWPLWLLLWSGSNAVYIAADLFNTYVALELVTVAAVGLVAIGGRDSLAPALRYLFVAILGSFAFLLAVALLYAETGTLSIAMAGEAVEPGFALSTALCIATIGLALKTALFPMHAWLPPAHAGAPSAVSPLMSALVIKVSFYVLVRLWISVPGSGLSFGLAQALGVLGSVAVVWGSVQALRQSRLKKVVAYSTVAQVGYFFLLFPLLTPDLDSEAAALAFQGAIVFVLAHGLAKAAMFMAAGVIVTSFGTDELTSLHGASERNPRAVLAFAIAGVSLAGLPPTLAFTGKWQILTSALESGQWWWLPVVLGGGVLTFAYTARVVAVAMLPAEEGKPWTTPPLRMQIVPVVLAGTVIVLGLQGTFVLDLVELPGGPR